MNDTEEAATVALRRALLAHHALIDAERARLQATIDEASRFQAKQSNVNLARRAVRGIDKTLEQLRTDLLYVN